MTSENIIEINPFEVRFLIHRERDPVRFNLLKEAIREIGVVQPLHVRRITDRPVNERRHKNGIYKWEAAFGEGRTTAMLELYRETKDERFLKLPALEKEIDTGEVVGRFLAENILRKDHSWLEQAKLIKAECGARISERPAKVVAEIAKRFFITPAHAAKLVRILSQASPAAEKELSKLTVAEAESLTSLPAQGQEIVIETMAEQGLDRTQIAAVVSKARQVSESGGELSKTALRASLRRVGEDLEKLRPRLKLARLHHSLGPENLRALLSDKAFRKQLDKHGVNYAKFTEAANS